MEINKIHNMDCIEGMKKLEDSSIDFIITDPPYGIASSNKMCKKGNKIISTNDYFGHFDNFDSKQDYINFINPILDQYQRILKDGSCLVIFLGREYINYVHTYLEDKGMLLKNYISIVKNNPLPLMNRKTLRSGFELGLLMSKGKVKKFNKLRPNQMINYDIYNIGIKESTHPNEKPKKIIKKYISIFSDKGDLILDSFMGSGTTAVACKELQRNYIGFEINKEYYNMSEDRLEKWNGQRCLFTTI